MNTELIEFFNVVLRFTHIVAAIMWIGNSLLFTWMEINLIKDPENKNSLGYMNMLHAGGVFFLDKRVIDPNDIPARLHVFKWQSYTTWLSGIALIVLTFYTRSGTLLLDPSKSDLLGWHASLISALSIIAAWFIYDAIWKSPLKKVPAAAVAVLALGLIGYAYWIDGFFNSRFVYLQVGAMIATTMTANVRFVIIPNQKKIMAALLEGKPHDLELGRQAKLRSLTNHYVTFPVIFLMLSAHFPILYGNRLYIPIMIIIAVSLVIIKWMMNLYNKFSDWLFASVATFILGTGGVALCIFLPNMGAKPVDTNTPAISSTAIKGKELFSSKGCSACHLPVDSSIAPSLHGIYGTERPLTDGSSVLADEAYIKHSIQFSTDQVSKGYAPAMPSFDKALSEEELNQLVAYIESLSK
jgi:Predicted membrane protein